MSRPEFRTRKILFRTEAQKQVAHAIIDNLPLDKENPIEGLFREEVKPRKLSQNALMWAGPLSDIANQAWYQGQKFSAEIWHELFKRMYLPEDDDPEIHLLAKEGYRKWDYLPTGERVLVGSTTDLLVRGMAQYITQIEAHGADLGVQFRSNPNEEWAA